MAPVLAAGEPLIRWEWIGRNWDDDIAEALTEHLILSLVPVAIGLAVALPLGIACARWRRLYPPVLAATSVLYAVPAIALFVVLVAFTGLTYATVIIPLAAYTLSVLVPGVVDGLRSVPDHVRQAAEAMGFGPVRRLVQVELPLAVPVVMAGLRVAAVSNISLVSVGSLIGIGGLGELFVTGLKRDFPTPIIVGIALTIALALAADLLLLLLQRLLTPWERTGGRAAAPKEPRRPLVTGGGER
ncbi:MULTISPECIES: ABC transporter permease [Thermomonospora]|uniref:Binding-protein-dependent transport systems inner membrane component n=1 Tax=Thermomonospora curvata (strain ATCC 19995 / DSM 43183 / JCM 3096 / KCTC 9072 / NBRC 15933 / NCIMB 10081 / Henssen B9) TaxID=471852 RepID=D1ACB0_THECD|nr:MULTISPECIES: ABC transporter permease [Thermomonospora]ACY99169.1 binding-protein-dependent transport systems inner membrane component [Thermomonospora curvata DSM 43183]PKK13342.1 MAG: ABC transporter permease [Thermomonospora sp. CIF 1]